MDFLNLELHETKVRNNLDDHLDLIVHMFGQNNFDLKTFSIHDAILKWKDIKVHYATTASQKNCCLWIIAFRWQVVVGIARATIRLKTGECHFLSFQISPFGKFVHHETFLGGTLNRGWFQYKLIENEVVECFKKL